MAGQDTITLAFIGDVMQHYRQLQSARIKGGDTLNSKSYDYSSYFRHTAKILSDADFAVANMEFVCGLPPYTGYPSFSAPLSLAEATSQAGIDLFLCANNHIFDKGERGYNATVSGYDSLGVAHTGVYRDKAEQDSLNPYITEIRGVKFSFINFTYGTNIGAKKARVNRMDSLSVLSAIQRARENSDFIVALPHWGVEYSLTPSPQQKKWEKFLYSQGVDMIIGSHPHVVQPVNYILDNSGAIKHLTAYSLGNYISNMSAKNTQIGFIFVVNIVKDDKGCRIVSGEPIWLWCARGGRFDKNYTTLIIKDYKDHPEAFPIRHEYDNMISTYNRLREIINYGE